MSQLLTPALFGFLGGFIGGALSGWATVYVHWKRSKSLESDELRRKKVEIIYKLLGSRYVLVSDYPASERDVFEFNTAMALFSSYFRDDKDVLQRYDSFTTDRSDANLVALLQAAASKAGLVLLDSQIKQVMSVHPQHVPYRIEISLTGADGAETSSTSSEAEE